MLAPFIERLLSSLKVREQNDPSQLSKIAFDLYLRQKQDCTRIKTKDIHRARRSPFERFLNEVKAGHSPLTGTDGVEVLDSCNHFFGLSDPLDDSGLDIGSHFRMSSSFSPKGRLLYNAVKAFRPSTMLEVGTAYGQSAQFLLSAARRFSPDAVLHTIEAGEPQFTLANESITARFGDRAVLQKGLSTDVIPDLVNHVDAFDLVFHDGAHDGQTYQSDFDALLPSLRTGSVVIFDDIRWFDKRIVSEDPGCYAGWKSIVERPEVGLAVEIGKSVGIVMVDRD